MPGCEAHNSSRPNFSLCRLAHRGSCRCGQACLVSRLMFSQLDACLAACNCSPFLATSDKIDVTNTSLNDSISLGTEDEENAGGAGGAAATSSGSSLPFVVGVIIAFLVILVGVAVFVNKGACKRHSTGLTVTVSSFLAVDSGGLMPGADSSGSDGTPANCSVRRNTDRRLLVAEECAGGEVPAKLLPNGTGGTAGPYLYTSVNGLYSATSSAVTSSSWFGVLGSNCLAGHRKCLSTSGQGITGDVESRTVPVGGGSASSLVLLDGFVEEPSVSYNIPQKARSAFRLYSAPEVVTFGMNTQAGLFQPGDVLLPHEVEEDDGNENDNAGDGDEAALVVLVHETAESEIEGEDLAVDDEVEGEHCQVMLTNARDILHDPAGTGHELPITALFNEKELVLSATKGGGKKNVKRKGKDHETVPDVKKTRKKKKVNKENKGKVVTEEKDKKNRKKKPAKVDVISEIGRSDQSNHNPPRDNDSSILSSNKIASGVPGRIVHIRSNGCPKVSRTPERSPLIQPDRFITDSSRLYDLALAKPLDQVTEDSKYERSSPPAAGRICAGFARQKLQFDPVFQRPGKGRQQEVQVIATGLFDRPDNQRLRRQLLPQQLSYGHYRLLVRPQGVTELQEFTIPATPPTLMSSSPAFDYSGILQIIGNPFFSNAFVKYRAFFICGSLIYKLKELRCLLSFGLPFVFGPSSIAVSALFKMRFGAYMHACLDASRRYPYIVLFYFVKCMIIIFLMLFSNCMALLHHPFSIMPN
ncbi:unnamed protein product [Protopolystoma xenopodis]|uniref:Uncharacterized protein n=1 Tax=Protopolystoma xenopodis TaxID=117903 RepID=A0A3S5A9V3_9PLAT|nr:unnamed protein product [Protopolystoma xenopodis]